MDRVGYTKEYKNWRFRPISRFISNMAQGTAIVITEGE